MRKARIEPTSIKGVSAGTMHQKIVKSAEKVLRC
jgi:hypothetical protein